MRRNLAPALSPARARRGSVPLVLCVACMLAVSTPGVARADKVDELISGLSGGSAKVRLSAALSLGRIGDPRAISPLVSALGDGDRSVRGVAAAALGRLVTRATPDELRAEVLENLRAVASDDGDATVRQQAVKAASAVASIVPPEPPTPRVSGVYLELGPLSDKTKKFGGILPAMRAAAKRAASRAAPAFQVAESESAPAFAEVQRAGRVGFYVDGTVTTISVGRRGGPVVSCEVSLVVATLPTKSMFAFPKGKAAAEAASMSDKHVAEAASDCVVAVMEDLVARQVVPLLQARAQ